MSSRYGSRAAIHQHAVSAILGSLAADQNIAPALSNTFAMMVRPKPAEIEVSEGFPHPLDDSLLEWNTVVMSRKEAADAIRAAMKRGLTIERSTTGYCISGAVHPVWRY